MRQKPHQRSREEWLSLIDGWKRSKLSAKQFCRKRAIPYSSFIGWRNRHAQEANWQNTGSFLPFVELRTEAPAKEEPLSLLISDGQLQIHLPLEADPLLIARCLKAFKEVASCSR